MSSLFESRLKLWRISEEALPKGFLEGVCTDSISARREGRSAPGMAGGWGLGVGRGLGGRGQRAGRRAREETGLISG